MGAKFCSCPHVATATGLMRSGWSIDCPFHGGHAPHAAHQPPLQGTINVTVPPATPPPVSEERITALVEENDARQASLIQSYGYTSPQLVEFRKMLDEIRDSRTTIAALRKELDELRGKNSTKE